MIKTEYLRWKKNSSLSRLPIIQFEVSTFLSCSDVSEALLKVRNSRDFVTWRRQLMTWRSVI